MSILTVVFPYGVVELVAACGLAGEEGERDGDGTFTVGVTHSNKIISPQIRFRGDRFFFFSDQKTSSPPPLGRKSYGDDYSSILPSCFSINPLSLLFIELDMASYPIHIRYTCLN
jgi:hypothetical protein